MKRAATIRSDIERERLEAPFPTASPEGQIIRVLSPKFTGDTSTERAVNNLINQHSSADDVVN